MVAGECADTISTKEFALVQHADQDATESLLVDYGHHAPLTMAEVPFSPRVHAAEDVRLAACSLTHVGHEVWNFLSLPRLHHGCGAQGKESDHRPNLQPFRASVGPSQYVVVEAIFLVPHSLRALSVQGTRDEEKVVDKPHGQVFEGRVVCGDLDSNLKHVLAEERHPSRAVRLLQMAPSRERRCAVEDADVVQAEETTLEDIFPEPVLA